MLRQDNILLCRVALAVVLLLFGSPERRCVRCKNVLDRDALTVYSSVVVVTTELLSLLDGESVWFCQGVLDIYSA